MLLYDHSPVRAACDSCHARKIRCIKSVHNQCRSCRENDRICQFSPRLTMGRPRNWRSPITTTVSRMSETLENLDSTSSSNNETRSPPRLVQSAYLFYFSFPLWSYVLITGSDSQTPILQSTPDYLADNLNPPHHLPFGFQQDNSHEDDCTLGVSSSLRPPKKPNALITPDDNINLQCFARLSELQFDLHQHRDRLLVEDGLVAESLPQLPGLDLVLGTIDQVSEVVDVIMRREDLLPLACGIGQQAAEILSYSSGLKLLALTIIRESLGVHQILISITANSSFLKSAIGDTGLSRSASSSARFKLGTFTTSEQMSQILVLTLIDHHVLSFYNFLHSYLSEQAIGGGLTTPLLDAKARLRQIQLSLMVILDDSKINNVSSMDFN